MSCLPHQPAVTVAVEDRCLLHLFGAHSMARYTNASSPGVRGSMASRSPWAMASTRRYPLRSSWPHQGKGWAATATGICHMTSVSSTSVPLSTPITSELSARPPPSCSARARTGCGVSGHRSAPLQANVVVFGGGVTCGVPGVLRVARLAGSRRGPSPWWTEHPPALPVDGVAALIAQRPAVLGGDQVNDDNHACGVGEHLCCGLRSAAGGSAGVEAGTDRPGGLGCQPLGLAAGLRAQLVVLDDVAFGDVGSGSISITAAVRSRK